MRSRHSILSYLFLFSLFGSACVFAAVPSDQAARRPLRVVVVPLSVESAACPAVRAAEGIRFDVDGQRDGVAEWLDDPSAVAFLAIDENRNGVIDNAAELVSNRMSQNAGGAFDVLNQVAIAKASALSVIDSRHPLYSDLLLWTDANRNGRSELSELRPVSEYLAWISLGAQLLKDQGACRLKGATVTRADWRGQPRPNDRIQPIYEVVLRITP